MKDKEFVIEQKLRDIYYDPSAGFQSAERLYQKAKDDGLSVSRRIVKEWLKTQDTYTRHKPIVRKHKFQRTFVKDLADQIQMDLVDMGKYKNQNKGYYWILTAVEILSRYAFTIPVYRKDTKNMTKAVGDLLEEFKERFGKYPNVAQFDEGKEFYNVGVRDLLTKNNIEYFSTNSERKAAIVERFNRTLKTSMWKYFYSKGTYTWVDILDDLTDNYNHSKHRTIMMKPADVNKSNKDRVWITLYGYVQGDFPIPKFKVDDTVRVSKYKNIFDKGYETNFTEEIFKIARVFRGDPNMYELVDVDDEPIIGKFYEEELSAINKTDDVYRVEKILKRRKGQALVKWAGYDSKHNSWVPIKDIQSLNKATHMDVIELDNTGEDRAEQREETERVGREDEETSFIENTAKTDADNIRTRISSEPTVQSDVDLNDFDAADVVRRMNKGKQDKEEHRDGARQILEIITREKKFGDYGEKSSELLDNLSEAKFNEKGKLTALKFKGKDVKLTVKGLVNKTATVQNREIFKAIEDAKAEYEESADAVIDKRVGFSVSDEARENVQENVIEKTENSMQEMYDIIEEKDLDGNIKREIRGIRRIDKSVDYENLEDPTKTSVRR